MKALIPAVLLLTTAPALAADTCAAQIPHSLVAAVGKTFPKFRVPAATDNLEEDIDWNVKNGGKGCLGVAKADFDGDGKMDFLLGLSALEGSGGLVVVALSRGREWSFKTLSPWPKNRDRLYVATDKPGVYERTEALDGPLEPGERDHLKCMHSAAIFGTTESSGVAYCFNKGVWEHVWISD